jgi:hypothetical protein
MHGKFQHSILPGSHAIHQSLNIRLRGNPLWIGVAVLEVDPLLGGLERGSRVIGASSFLMKKREKMIHISMT